MRFHRSTILALSLVALAGCGRSPKSFDSHAAPGRVTVSAARAGDPTYSVGRPLRNPPSLQLAATRRHLWNETIVVNAMVANAAAERAVYQRTSSSNRTAAASDLPPDWVIQRESHGDYNVINWGGCGGNNCYGRYQFSGAWAGKLGLPADLSTATPEQQDEAARQLWNGGAGCSNWQAC